VLQPQGAGFYGGVVAPCGMDAMVGQPVSVEDLPKLSVLSLAGSFRPAAGTSSSSNKGAAAGAGGSSSSGSGGARGGSMAAASGGSDVVVSAGAADIMACQGRGGSRPGTRQPRNPEPVVPVPPTT
jgi:hypothetical protein